MLAHKVGELLKDCSWVGVPFAGGMCELGHITARTMHVNDLHRGVINLARVVRDRREELQAACDAMLFHPDELKAAQDRCRHRDRFEFPPFLPDLQYAVDYFVCAWMTRSGQAGTPGEFTGKLAVRWEAGGGDSAVRFRSAAESLTEWQAVMRRCTFDTLDAFDFLAKCKDRPRHGIYCDPPFPGPGDGYTHKFGEAEHRSLAETLAGFRYCTVVCRFYRHPLIEKLYPADRWRWIDLAGRKQTNAAAPEVLLVGTPQEAV